MDGDARDDVLSGSTFSQNWEKGAGGMRDRSATTQDEGAGLGVVLEGPGEAFAADA